MLALIVCIAVPVALGKILDTLHVDSDFVTPIGFSAAVYYHIFGGFATIHFVKPYGKAFVGYISHFYAVFRLSVAVKPMASNELRISNEGRRMTAVS